MLTLRAIHLYTAAFQRPPQRLTSYCEHTTHTDTQSHLTKYARNMLCKSVWQDATFWLYLRVCSWSWDALVARTTVWNDVVIAWYGVRHGATPTNPALEPTLCVSVCPLVCVHVKIVMFIPIIIHV